MQEVACRRWWLPNDEASYVTTTRRRRHMGLSTIMEGCGQTDTHRSRSVGGRRGGAWLFGAWRSYAVCCTPPADRG